MSIIKKTKDYVYKGVNMRKCMQGDPQRSTPMQC